MKELWLEDITQSVVQMEFIPKYQNKILPHQSHIPLVTETLPYVKEKSTEIRQNHDREKLFSL